MGMAKKIALKIEEMTAATFAPFGEVWAARDMPPDRRIMRKTEFACDGDTSVSVIWQPKAPCTFSEVERHFGVTQGFVQLSGGASVVCVAPPSATDDPADVPAPESVRAFFINPGMGYAFKRGTWHSLNRFVIEGDGATFLIINSEPNPTHMIDYQTGAISVFSDLDNCEPATSSHLTPFDAVFELDLKT